MRRAGVRSEDFLMSFRQSCKADAFAVFDDRTAGAVQVYVDVVAFVHAELPAR